MSTPSRNGQRSSPGFRPPGGHRQGVAAGAIPSSVDIVDFDEVPLPYLPGNATRIRAKAVGDLALGGLIGTGASR